MKKLLLIVCVGIVASLLIVGCGSNEDKAKSAVKKGLEHLKAGNIEKALDYVDLEGFVEEMKKQMEPMLAMLPEEQKKEAMDDFTIEKIRENAKKEFKKEDIKYEILSSEAFGDDAVKVTVKLSAKDEDEETVGFIMKKIDGKWKCDMMATTKEMEKKEESKPEPAE